MNHVQGSGMMRGREMPLHRTLETRGIRRRGRYASGYDEWTDGELHAHAARLNITGHEQMSREDLVAVLSGP